MSRTPSSPPQFAVFLIVLLDVMGLGLIIPAQPFLAKHFGASPGTVTLVGTTYALAQFLLSPVWGALSDKFGRRPILLATLFITALGHTLFAGASSLALLFGARALAGIGAANISTAQAVLSDTYPPSERSRAMAIIGAAFGLGFILGPLLGGILFSTVSHSAPALFAAALAVMNIIFVALRVPETRTASASPAHKRGKLLDFLTLDRTLQRLILTTFFTITAFSLMEQTIGLYIESIWVHTDGESGMRAATSLTSWFLVVVGISAIVVQGYFVRKWLKTTSEVVLFRFGLATIALSLVLIPVLGENGSYTLFLIAGVLLALGSGLFNPSMAGLVSLVCPADKQGLGLALNQSGQALGRIVGPTIAGSLFTIGRPAPFLTGACLAVLALLISRNISSPRPSPSVLKQGSSFLNPTLWLVCAAFLVVIIDSSSLKFLGHRAYPPPALLLGLLYAPIIPLALYRGAVSGYFWTKRLEVKREQSPLIYWYFLGGPTIVVVAAIVAELTR